MCTPHLEDPQIKGGSPSTRSCLQHVRLKSFFFPTKHSQASRPFGRAGSGGSSDPSFNTKNRVLALPPVFARYSEGFDRSQGAIMEGHLGSCEADCQSAS